MALGTPAALSFRGQSRTDRPTMRSLLMSSQPSANVDRDREKLPDNEAVIRRPQRVVTLPPSTQRPYRTEGLKGGQKIELTAIDRMFEPPPEVMRKGRSR